MRIILTVFALMLPPLVLAQWRIGANVGTSYNHPTINKQYMTDLAYKDCWGVNFGVMGQPVRKSRHSAGTRPPVPEHRKVGRKN